MENIVKIDLGGRPFKFTNIKKLKVRLQRYFDNTPFDDLTVTGLALSLDCDRDTLLNYEKNKNGQSEAVPDEVVRLIRKAKMIIHNAYEKDLRRKSRSGDIFALKNFGWRDQYHNDLTSGDKPFSLLNGESQNAILEDDSNKQNIEPKQED